MEQNYFEISPAKIGVRNIIEKQTLQLVPQIKPCKDSCEDNRIQFQDLPGDNVLLIKRLASLKKSKFCFVAHESDSKRFKKVSKQLGLKIKHGERNSSGRIKNSPIFYDNNNFSIWEGTQIAWADYMCGANKNYIKQFANAFNENLQYGIITFALRREYFNYSNKNDSLTTKAVKLVEVIKKYLPANLKMNLFYGYKSERGTPLLTVGFSKKKFKMKKYYYNEFSIMGKEVLI